MTTHCCQSASSDSDNSLQAGESIFEDESSSFSDSNPLSHDHQRTLTSQRGASRSKVHTIRRSARLASEGERRKRLKVSTSGTLASGSSRGLRPRRDSGPSQGRRQFGGIQDIEFQEPEDDQSDQSSSANSSPKVIFFASSNQLTIFQAPTTIIPAQSMNRNSSPANFLAGHTTSYESLQSNFSASDATGSFELDQKSSGNAGRPEPWKSDSGSPEISHLTPQSSVNASFTLSGVSSHQGDIVEQSAAKELNDHLGSAPSSSVPRVIIHLLFLTFNEKLIKHKFIGLPISL